MIRINQLKLPIGHTTAALEKKIQKALHLLVCYLSIGQ